MKTRVRLGMQKLRESPAAVLLRARPMSHPEQERSGIWPRPTRSARCRAEEARRVRGVSRRLAGGAARGGGVSRGGGAARACGAGGRAVARSPGARARPRPTRRRRAPSAGPVRPPRPWLALAAGLVAVVGLGFGYVQLDDRARSPAGAGPASASTLERTSDMLHGARGHAERDPGARGAVVPAHRQRRPGPPGSSSSGTGSDTGPCSTASGSSRCPRVGRTSSGSSRTASRCRRSPSAPSRRATSSVERIEVPADGDVTAAALTVEPESGSPQPTTPIVLVGPLQARLRESCAARIAAVAVLVRACRLARVPRVHRPISHGSDPPTRSGSPPPPTRRSPPSRSSRSAPASGSAPARPMCRSSGWRSTG